MNENRAKMALDFNIDSSNLNYARTYTHMNCVCVLYTCHTYYRRACVYAVTRMGSIEICGINRNRRMN